MLSLRVCVCMWHAKRSGLNYSVLSVCVCVCVCVFQSSDGNVVVRSDARVSSLTLKYAQYTDAGQYVCTARNAIGHDSQSMFLEVRCKSHTLTHTHSMSAPRTQHHLAQHTGHIPRILMEELRSLIHTHTHTYI